MRIVNIEDDTLPEDTKDIRYFARCFQVDKKIFVHIAGTCRYGIGPNLRAALNAHSRFLLSLEPPRQDSVERIRAYHFMFHKQRAILGIDDPTGWESHNMHLVRRALEK